MNISAKSADFTCSSSREEVKNVSANQRLGQPPWISNGFKMIQFFRSPRRTILVSLMAGHSLVLKMLNFFTTYRRIDRDQTLFDKKNSGALKLLGK